MGLPSDPRSALTVCHFEGVANTAKGGWKERYELLHSKPPQPTLS
jgi:hypothetical protein